MNKLKEQQWAKTTRWFHLGLYNRFFGHFPSFRLRHFLLRNFYGMKIGKDTNLESGITIFSPERISIGNNCVIHFDCILDGRCNITIGNCVDIGQQVNIFTLEHDIDDPFYNTKGDQVIINDYAIISGRSIILPGITIGEGAVIASSSVVTKNVLPYTLVGGVPAKYIRDRNPNLKYKINYRRSFH